MKKTVACIMMLILLIPMFSLLPSAYGKGDQKMVVTHMNYDATAEGIAAIYTPAQCKTLGDKGNFAWWTVVVCEWDSDAKVYTVKSVNAKMNSDKSNTVVPENGFVYAANVGNNWPQLVKDDSATYGQYADKPNYTSERVTSSINLAAELAAGDKVYLYGCDVLNATASTNGKLWYEDGYESYAYMKKGSPDGDNWYNPESAVKTDVMYTLNVNMINDTQEGASMIVTRGYGKSLADKGYNFAWWKTATFDWNGECFECVSLNLAANGNAIKESEIPENGFVYAVNLGNDYSSNGGINYTNSIATAAFSTIESVTVGSKAYLKGIDLGKGTIQTNGALWHDKTFKSDSAVYINVAPNAEIYSPTVSESRPTAMGEITVEESADEFSFKWDAVSGAEKYLVTLYDSHEIPDGKRAVKAAETSENSFSIKRSDLSIGYTYTVRIIPVGDSEGFESRRSFYVYDEKAANSPYRDKTIVAFGDSITAFTGWVGMLKSMLGTEVINSGVGGNTTNDAVARLQKDVLDYKPDIVIVNFGANDQAIVMSENRPNVSLEKYEENYRKIIEECRSIGARVILVSVHRVYAHESYYKPGGYGLNYAVEGNLDKFIAVQEKLAAEYGLERIPITEYAAAEGGDKMCALGDGLHLSAYGQQMYTKWIGEYLMNNTGDALGEVSKDETSEASDATPAVTSSEDVSNTSEAPKGGRGGVIGIILGAAVVVSLAAAAIWFIRKKK